MAIIKNIDVKMTFNLGLGNYEASKEIKEEGIHLTLVKESEYPNAF